MQQYIRASMKCEVQTLQKKEMNTYKTLARSEKTIIPFDVLQGFFFKKKSRSHPKDTEAISGVKP